jgi:hypothetical protein
MKLNTFAEAVMDYERITKERFLWQITSEPLGYGECLNLVVLPSNEWFMYAIREHEGERYIWLDQMYGFMKNFTPLINEIMEREGVKILLTATTRDPKMHIRKWDVEHLYDYEFEGRHYHILKGTVDGLNGRKKERK